MRILSICTKSSDNNSISFTDNNGVKHKSSDYSYVPANIGIGGGDYIELDIDMDSGQILNWKPVSDEKIIDEINKAS